MKRIYLEGLPGSGKTTLLNALSREGCTVVSEIGNYFKYKELPGEGENIYEMKKNIEWFISHEKKRIDQEGIFDRSFLSHLAFYYAYQKLTGMNGCFDLCVKKYENAVRNRILELPSLMVFLDFPINFSLANLKKREEKGFHKLAEYWYNPHFLKDIKKAYKIMSSLKTMQGVQLSNTNIEINKFYIVKFWSNLKLRKSNLNFFNLLKEKLTYNNGNC